MPARKATKVCYLLLFGGRTRHESFAVWHLASQGTERTPTKKARAAPFNPLPTRRSEARDDSLHERADLSHWCKQFGDRLELLLAESLRVAHEVGRVTLPRTHEFGSPRSSPAARVWRLAYSEPSECDDG